MRIKQNLTPCRPIKALKQKKSEMQKFRASKLLNYRIKSTKLTTSGKMLTEQEKSTIGQLSRNNLSRYTLSQKFIFSGNSICTKKTRSCQDSNPKPDDAKATMLPLGQGRKELEKLLKTLKSWKSEFLKSKKVI